MIILALFSEVEFENFDVHRSDRDYATSSRTRGGGVFIAVRKSLGSKLVPNTLSSSSYCNLLFVSFRSVKVRSELILLGCTYIPPSSSLDSYIDHCSAVERVCSDFPDATIYLLGDYNLTTATWCIDDEYGMIVSCPPSSPAIHVCESFNSPSIR